MSEPEVSNLITVDRAIQILETTPVERRVKQIALHDALGHRLAEELRADRDAPPFDKSVMDGFAVRSADLPAGGAFPIELPLAGTVPAGADSSLTLKPGAVIAIMTGAPLPDGADAVVPVEKTISLDKSSGRVIRFSEPAKVGQSIARRGSDIRGGEVVMETGTLIEGPQIAVAASIGASRVNVFELPSVGVLGTGDELVSVDQIPTGSQIRSSNNLMLMGLLKRLPCRPADLGTVVDDPARIRNTIIEGLKHDVLFITGGMSMGERDYVPAILRELGGMLEITKVRIRPGKPFAFARMPGGQFVFGLPGNPVSAFVCTLYLASRLLRRISGADETPANHFAPLGSDLPENGPRTFLQPAWFDGQTIAPFNWKGSADIFTLSRANSLIIRPENQSAQKAGALIEYIDLRAGGSY